MIFRFAFLFTAVSVFHLDSQVFATEADLGKVIKALKEVDTQWTDQIGNGKGIYMKCKSNEGRLRQDVLFRLSKLGKICQRTKSATGLSVETTVFMRSQEAHSVVRRPEPDNKTPPWAYSQTGDACLAAIFSDEEILLSPSRIASVPLYEVIESIEPSRLAINTEGDLLVIQFDAEKPTKEVHGWKLPFMVYPCAVSVKLDLTANMRILEYKVNHSNSNGTVNVYGFENRFSSQDEFSHVQFSGSSKDRKVRHEAIVKRVDAPALKEEELSLAYYGIELSDQVAGRSFPWLLVIGTAVLVCGLILKFVTRRSL